MKKIALRELGEKLGLETRTLRYVVEAELVPGITAVNRGRGSRRELTTEQAVLVATAAMLYARGIRGGALQETLRKVKTKCRTGDQARVHLTKSPMALSIAVTGLGSLREALSKESPCPT